MAIWIEALKKDKLKLFMAVQLKRGIILFATISLGWTSLSAGQSLLQTQMADPGSSQTSLEHSQESSLEKPGKASTSQQSPGRISGMVVDQSGALVAGARVRLTRTGENESLNPEMLSRGDGQFSFDSLAPGPFQLTITSGGFAPQTFSGMLHPGENYVVPQISLAVASNVSEMEVGLSQTDVAEEQIKIEEKQRVLGVIPNFYVSYIPDAAPLTSKQKFKLALRTVVDPATFVFVGGAAGVEQAQNHFAGYGQGAQGYGKRFGANYADTITGTFLGGAVFPSILKQDPRYFYKGVGSVPSRFLYALASSVICKGDNKRWQPNYSNVLGSLAAGGISNVYYPAQDRNGAGLTFENGALGIVATAASNLFQEFVIRRLTPRVAKSASNSTPVRP